MIKIRGIENLRKKLEDLEKRANSLGGLQILVSELLSPSFVSKHTRFSSAEELFEAGGFKVETEEDLAAIPDDLWDLYIQSVSEFKNWQAMLDEAIKEWAMKGLGF
jgi:hypothetical protein